MERVFYRCALCGNLVGLVNDGGGELVCCGQPMEKLAANSKDAAREKHVPEITLEGSTLHVRVGDIAHPMTPEHYIQWIMVAQGEKTQRAALTPDCEPKATFVLDSADEAFTVYEYCNLHGLWKKES